VGFVNAVRMYSMVAGNPIGKRVSALLTCHVITQLPMLLCGFAIYNTLCPMTTSELRPLAERWVAYRKADKDSPEREALFWVNERVWELVADEPLLAWAMILEVLKIDSSNKIQEVLAAGPLEDLLATHGPLIIESVEREAKDNAKFAQLLGGVWQYTMTEDIWARVQAVWDRRGWDGIPEA
jgi:hypothetical protein